MECDQYGDIAKLLDKARDKGLADDAKIGMLWEVQSPKGFCIRLIERLLNLL